MTYHPKQMIASALFLSTKTENHYISLKSFVANMSNSAETTEEDVIAPEFLLSQGLRFTFDVRHPQRGLEGGFMELLAMSTGSHKPAPGCQDTARSLQQRMLRLEQEVGGPPQPSTPQLLKTRIQMAHGRTKEMLKTSALLTDAYFLYTPSQIWLAAFWLADEPLTHFYLSTKFSERVPSKLLETLESCADLLSSSPALVASPEEKKELKRIDKKLYKCRNPEKMDLIGINKAQKRDEKAKNDLGVDEKVIKKRKTEKDNGLTHMEDPFGPTLKN
jgi:cyclin H